MRSREKFSGFEDFELIHVVYKIQKQFGLKKCSMFRNGCFSLSVFLILLELDIHHWPGTLLLTLVFTEKVGRRVVSN